MSTKRVLTLQSIQVAGSQLSIRYQCEKHQFSLCYWYDFNLESLNEIYGSEFVESVYFNCAAFSAFHLCSLKPDVIDWGPYSRWHTAEFERVWKTAWKGLSGQWRYQNNLCSEMPPAFASVPSPATDAIKLETETPTTLAFFGGGKDSMVMYELFTRANIPFSCVTYSHTIYGRSTVQHDLSDKVLNLLSSDPVRHRLSIFDDFLDSPVLESLGKKIGISSFMESEGPSSLFAALPIVLRYRYTSIAYGNERSSNVGNLMWEKTGEEINHQWGKSKQSEALFNDYIQQALLRNVQYFSGLQPIYDATIFSVAKSRLQIATQTHSCNIVKPWCKKCPKCCYVWLMFMAFFPREAVDEMFSGTNLLDLPENQVHFVQMLGLGSNKPFECIGEFDEAKLALEVCDRKGLQGKAMEVYKGKIQHTVQREDWSQMVDRYTDVYTADSENIPAVIKAKLFSVLKQAADTARNQLQAILMD